MVTQSTPRKRVVIVGAGTQGRRLAYMWSSQGDTVCLVDQQEAQLRAAQEYISDLRKRDSTESTSPPWGQVVVALASEMQSVLADAWLILECIPENLSLKRKIITKLDEVGPHDAIIASNSSSYAISEVIEGLELRNSSRVLSAHSYWPPETSSLEIMGHSSTDPSLITLLLKESASRGFSPFHVKKDSIGYIYNRIWAAIKREALLVLSEGVAGPEEVDALFKDVLKTPKGPCEQMDVVGLDVVLDIENHYAEARQGIPEEPRTYLKCMIEDGKLGVKNGSGFYEYGQSQDGKQTPKILQQNGNSRETNGH